jgi:pimeloyl-ACP methyl ester carboxylesterase
MFDLVKTSTKDGIYLSGLFRPAEDKENYVVLYIHGFDTDFYSSEKVCIYANSLASNNIGFLSAETRGTAGQKKFSKTDGKKVDIGSQYELLKDSYKDIDAWVEFLIENGYHNIILLGGSLGCNKAVRYFAEGDQTKYIKKLILVSPSDHHAMAEILTDGKSDEFFKVVRDFVSQGKEMELIESESFPMKMSYQTASSWFKKDHFGKMFNFADKDNSFMLLNKIDVPVKVIVGSKDEYINPKSESKDPVKEAVDIIKLNVNNIACAIIDGADHSYYGKEHEIAQEIIHFLVE